MTHARLFTDAELPPWVVFLICYIVGFDLVERVGYHFSVQFSAKGFAVIHILSVEGLSIDESIVTCDVSSTIYRLLPKILSIKMNMFIKSKYKVSAPKIATFLPSSDSTIT